MKAAGYRPRAIYEAQPGAARGHRPHRCRRVLERRPRAVPAAGRLAPGPRRLPAARRLPGLRRLPAAGERGLSRPGELDADVDPQLRARRPLLVGSLDPRVLPRHLGRRAGCGRSRRGMKTCGRTSDRNQRAARRHGDAATASTSASSRRSATAIELLLFDDARGGRAVARRPARAARAPHLSLLARASCRTCSRARSTATARTGRSRRNAACGSTRRRCSSIRTASRSPCRRAYDREAAIAPRRQLRRRDEERRRRAGGYDWEGDRPLRTPVRAHRHLRDARAGLHAASRAPACRNASAAPTPA